MFKQARRRVKMTPSRYIGAAIFALAVSTPASADFHDVTVTASQCGRVSTWDVDAPPVAQSAVRGSTVQIGFFVDDSAIVSGSGIDVTVEDVYAPGTPPQPAIGVVTTSVGTSRFGSATGSVEAGFSSGVAFDAPTATVVTKRTEAVREDYDGGGVLQPVSVDVRESWLLDVDPKAGGTIHDIPPVMVNHASAKTPIALSQISIEFEGSWNDTTMFTSMPPELTVPDFAQLVAADVALPKLKLRWENADRSAHVVNLCDVQTISVPEPSVLAGMLFGSLALTTMARRRTHVAR